jgi:hypothetical protein
MEKDYVKRMKTEFDELVAKIGKCGKFMATDKFSSLTEQKKNLLRIQYGIMSAYSDVLAERIRVEEE